MILPCELAGGRVARIAYNVPGEAGLRSPAREMESRTNRPETLCVAGLAVVVLLSAPGAAHATTPEFRDALRQQLLSRINHDRLEQGVAPVSLDPRASAMADAYCQRQIRDRTTGHFSLDGRAPYMRYSAAGLNDGMSENTAAWSAEYDFSEDAIPRLMIESHATMLDEQAPDDGHRKAILDPAATDVGVGFAWEGGEFRLVEIFLRRYVDWTHPVPRNAATTDHLWAAGRPLEGWVVDTVVVHYEPHPKPIAAMEASQRTTYGLPARRREYVPARQQRSRAARAITSGRSETDDVGDFSVHHDGSFSFDVAFPDGAGVYTVVVWVRREKDGTRVSASNVSIRVGAPDSALTGSP